AAALRSGAGPLAVLSHLCLCASETGDADLQRAANGSAASRRGAASEIYRGGGAGQLWRLHRIHACQSLCDSSLLGRADPVESDPSRPGICDLLLYLAAPFALCNGARRVLDGHRISLSGFLDAGLQEAIDGLKA